MNPLRFVRRRRRGDSDFAAEIAAHLALETDRLVAEGMSRADAVYEARRRFGNVGRVREEFHDRRTSMWIDGAARHLHRAARRIAHAPVFTIAAVLTLMLGIGATTAVFSLVDGVLLRPLPFAHPEQLVDLSHTMVIQGISHVDQSDATYLYYRRANHVFSAVGAYQSTTVNLADASAADGASAARVDAARATASVFAMLGVAPIRGRYFRDDEDLPSAAPAVVIGEGLWRTRYAGDPAVVGARVNVDGVTRTVIGIMPAAFEFPDGRTTLWLPAGIDPARTQSANFDLRGIARLRPGVTPTAAAADLDRLLPHVPEAFPGRLTAPAIAVTKMHPAVHSLRDTTLGGVARALWIVFGAAALLLLIACANVANLFLVRAEQRQHDLVLRRALGAGGGAIFAEYLAEGVLLAALGGALGVALAGAGLAAFRSMPSGIAIPRLNDVGIDVPVLGAATAVTLLTALVMSVVPALRSTSIGIANVLGQGTRSVTATRNRHRARRAFVVVQIALGLVLVTGAGLMARSFASLRSVPAGFDAAGAYTFRVALPNAAYSTADAVSLITRAVDRLSSLPNVVSAGVISKLPLDDESRRDTAVFVEDKPPAMGAMPVIHQVVYASPHAFAALGVPLVEGRTFERPEASRAQLDVIVSHALAVRYWGNAPAVGKRLRLDMNGPLFTIVGVTGDVRGTRLDEPPDETVYLPLVTAPGHASATGGADTTRWMPRELAFVVRSRDASLDPTVAVEHALRDLAPGVPVYDVRSMAGVVAQSTARTTFTLDLLEIASIAALLIGAVGLYGVVSYMVSLRTREMAVRIALGAEPARLRRQVLWQAVRVAALGLVLGTCATLLVTRYLAALLYGVAPRDPATLAGAVVLMAIIAVAASWFPARRAAAIDPAAALRTDA